MLKLKIFYKFKLLFCRTRAMTFGWETHVATLTAEVTNQWQRNRVNFGYSGILQDFSDENQEYSKKIIFNSWHEIGIYDLPAMVDYTLATTKQQKITYIGHSQGTTAFFVLNAVKPWYNDRFTAFYALSPIAYSKNMFSPVIQFVARFGSQLDVRNSLSVEKKISCTINLKEKKNRSLDDLQFIGKIRIHSRRIIVEEANSEYLQGRCIHASSVQEYIILGCRI